MAASTHVPAARSSAPVTDAGAAQRIPSFVDNRQFAVAQRRRAELAFQSPQTTAMRAREAVLQRKDWAIPAIREQIGGEGGDMSGHHIISKEDLTQLRQWAVDDYNADKKHQPNAFAFCMNDDAIFNWCKAQIKIFRETMVEPAFRRRKRQIEHEEATNGYAEDPSFRLSFVGNVNGIYIDAACSGEPDDNPVPEWKIDVTVKTIAPSEADGVQVTKRALVDFKKNNPVLPLP